MHFSIEYLRYYFETKGEMGIARDEREDGKTCRLIVDAGDVEDAYFLSRYDGDNLLLHGILISGLPMGSDYWYRLDSLCKSMMCDIDFFQCLHYEDYVEMKCRIPQMVDHETGAAIAYEMLVRMRGYAKCWLPRFIAIKEEAETAGD